MEEDEEEVEEETPATSSDCGQPCEHSSDCCGFKSNTMFCCPTYMLCMDSSTFSTMGDNCGKCAMHGSDNTADANAEGESNEMGFITDEEK